MNWIVGWVWRMENVAGVYIPCRTQRQSGSVRVFAFHLSAAETRGRSSRLGRAKRIRQGQDIGFSYPWIEAFWDTLYQTLIRRTACIMER